MRPRLPLVLASALVFLASWVEAVQLRLTSCHRTESVFSCAALLRPALASLGPVPVKTLLLAGALAQASAALLLRREPRPRFARAIAIVSALGAGLAIGLQPLAVIPNGRICPLCAGCVLTQGLLALAFARCARASGTALRPLAVAFVSALAVTAALASLQGAAQAREDARRRAALAALESKDARLVLVEGPGCPYCEALVLDVLGSSQILPRLARTRLRTVAHEERPDRGETLVPVLLALSRDGNVIARFVGFSPDLVSYEEVLGAAQR